MKLLMKRIIIMEMEVLANEDDPTHFQTRMHVINEYTKEAYNKLFAKLNVINLTFNRIKDIVEKYGEDKKNAQ